MSENTSMSFGEHFDNFIAEQLKTGRYASANEVVRTGLQLLENEEKLIALRQMLIEGEQSEYVYCSVEELMKELNKLNKESQSCLPSD